MYGKVFWQGVISFRKAFIDFGRILLYKFVVGIDLALFVATLKFARAKAGRTKRVLETGQPEKNTDIKIFTAAI